MEFQIIMEFGGKEFSIIYLRQKCIVFWAAQNNCETSATITNIPNTNTSDGSTVERHTWSTDAGCAYVEELKVIGGGHDWPGSFGNMDIDATQEIWQFVSRYDLNGLIACSTTSINENNSQQIAYTAYPNPCNDNLTIEIDLQEDTEFRIYSAFGQLVLIGKLDTNINTIDLSSLSPGAYVLSIGNQSAELVKTK